MTGGDLVSVVFDTIVGKLKKSAATEADEMIVVLAALNDFEAGGGRRKVMMQDNARLLEEREHAIGGRETNVLSGPTQFFDNLLGRQMAALALTAAFAVLKDGVNQFARFGEFETGANQTRVVVLCVCVFHRDGRKKAMRTIIKPLLAWPDKLRVHSQTARA